MAGHAGTHELYDIPDPTIVARRRVTIMQRKAGAAAFALVLLGAVLGSPLAAQIVEYKKVYSGDILPGYVPEGQLIETEGYLWVSSNGVFFNVAALSARWPLIIDVTEVPADMLAKVKSGCASERPSFTSGCQAVVRGRVGKIRDGGGDRRGIFATSIAPQP
jgi:hypothetical protein